MSPLYFTRVSVCALPKVEQVESAGQQIVFSMEQSSLPLVPLVEQYNSKFAGSYWVTVILLLS